MTLIVDAGPLYAAADRGDRDHDRCVRLFEAADRPLVVPTLVMTEVAYLLHSRLGSAAELAFGRSIERGELIVEPPAEPDWSRIVELAAEYADLGLGLVDASVVALAERLGVIRLATLDSRHFSVVRPHHAGAFELVP